MNKTAQFSKQQQEDSNSGPLDLESDVLTTTLLPPVGISEVHRSEYASKYAISLGVTSK